MLYFFSWAFLVAAPTDGRQAVEKESSSIDILNYFAFVCHREREREGAVSVLFHALLLIVEREGAFRI